MADIDTAKQTIPTITKGVEFIKSYNKHLVLAISLIVAGISINDGFKNSRNNQPVTGNVSTVIMSLIIGIGYFMYTSVLSGVKSNNLALLMAVAGFVAISLIVYVLVTVDSKMFAFFAYSTTAIMSLILIVGMAMFFYVFSNFLKSFTGWVGFMVYFLFYIPCMLLSFVHYITNEFKLTTSPVLILFVIEILLILFYVYIPDLINYISSQEGTPILEGSVYLNSPHTFNVGKSNIMPDMDMQLASNIDKTKFQNYALSMWTYVNAHGTTKIAYNTESLIFDHGNGKPKITYYHGDNRDSPQVYRIYFTSNSLIDKKSGAENADASYYELKLPMQRWNNLVFNYSSTHADLFVNGHLERTFSFANRKLPTMETTDVIKTGSVDGLHGAISNIRYYPNNVSKHRIASMYNIFMKKTPPVINL
jgi:hypothetical protein